VGLALHSLGRSYLRAFRIASNAACEDIGCAFKPWLRGAQGARLAADAHVALAM
jgi:hypothetical protein